MVLALAGDSTTTIFIYFHCVSGRTSPFFGFGVGERCWPQHGEVASPCQIGHSSLGQSEGRNKGQNEVSAAHLGMQLISVLLNMISKLEHIGLDVPARIGITWG